MEADPLSFIECPIRYIHEFDTVEAMYPSPELAMIPVAMCRDPFRLGKNKLVLCEFAYPDKRTKDVGEFNLELLCGISLYLLLLLIYYNFSVYLSRLHLYNKLFFIHNSSVTHLFIKHRRWNYYVI